MGQQDAHVEGFVSHHPWPSKISNAVHHLKREPRDDKQSQDQRQRSCQLFLFPKVSLTFVLDFAARFLPQAASDGTENGCVQYGHHEERDKSAKEKVNIDQVWHGDHRDELADNG